MTKSTTCYVKKAYQNKKDIYIYIYICVCVCVERERERRTRTRTRRIRKTKIALLTIKSTDLTSFSNHYEK